MKNKEKPFQEEFEISIIQILTKLIEHRPEKAGDIIRIITSSGSKEEYTGDFYKNLEQLQNELILK